VQLTLEDGGPNDADGLRNGIIKDPGGVGVSPQAVVDADNQVSTSSSGSSGGGGGGCTAGARGSIDPLLPMMLAVGVWAGVSGQEIKIITSTGVCASSS
jgi:hypothetical protein